MHSLGLFCQHLLQNTSTLSFPIMKQTWQSTCFLLCQCFGIQTQCAWHPRMKYNSRTFCTFCSKILAFQHWCLGLLKRAIWKQTKVIFPPSLEFFQSVKEFIFRVFHQLILAVRKVWINLRIKAGLDDILNEMNFEFGNFSGCLFHSCFYITSLLTTSVSIIH